MSAWSWMLRGALGAFGWPRSYAAGCLVVCALGVGICPAFGHTDEALAGDIAAIGTTHHSHQHHGQPGCRVPSCCGAALRTSETTSRTSMVMIDCPTEWDHFAVAQTAFVYAGPLDLVPPPPLGSALPLIC